MTDSDSSDSHSTVRLSQSTNPDDGRDENPWKEICESDPARVVHCLQLYPNSCDDGSGPTDASMALLALLEMAGGYHDGVEQYPTASKEVWDALVQAGITEALCENFIASRQPGEEVSSSHHSARHLHIGANTNVLRI